MSALRYSNKAVVTMIAKLQAIPRSLPNLSHPQPSHRFLISSSKRQQSRVKSTPGIWKNSLCRNGK